MTLTTRVEGPFSSVASILEAIIEDEGTAGGLVELITTIKYYAPVKSFKSSIISQWLETICPLLVPHTPTMSKGSQVLFVGAIREILNWERDASSKANCPFSSADIERLCELLNNLTHELLVEMAERALGTTLDTVEGNSSTSVRERALCVYNYVMAQRSSVRSSSEWQQSPPQSPVGRGY
ncbi:hypothetical protein H0H87_002931 [Tephrocybe sp. NHM501043]|nr:hypothetical protein H0H87_002931 [Tephrocybe sp. NHM501043]